MTIVNNCNLCNNKPYKKTNNYHIVQQIRKVRNGVCREEE